jgi:hypothetical protein
LFKRRKLFETYQRTRFLGGTRVHRNTRLIRRQELHQRDRSHPEQRELSETQQLFERRQLLENIRYQKDQIVVASRYFCRFACPYPIYFFLAFRKIYLLCVSQKVFHLITLAFIWAKLLYSSDIWCDIVPSPLRQFVRSVCPVRIVKNNAKAIKNCSIGFCTPQFLDIPPSQTVSCSFLDEAKE